MEKPKDWEQLDYTWEMYSTDIRIIKHYLIDIPVKFKYISGIVRGGLIPAVTISNQMGISFIQTAVMDYTIESLAEELIVIDDVAESGNTLALYKDNFKVALCARKDSFNRINCCGRIVQDRVWIKFPWE